MQSSTLAAFVNNQGEGKPVRTEMKTITYFHSDTNDKKIFAFKAMVDSAGQDQICHAFKAPSKAKVRMTLEE